MTRTRHLSVVPPLVGKWRVYPENDPMWLMPADIEAASMGIKYLPLQNRPHVTSPLLKENT